jgi:SWIM zinc finger
MNVFQFFKICFQIKNPQSNITLIVSLDNQQCSCGKFQELMFPCRHAAIAINRLHQPSTQYLHPSHLTVSLQSVYDSVMMPVDLHTLVMDDPNLPAVKTRTKIQGRNYYRKSTNLR